MVANNGCLRGCGSSVGSSFPFRGMPQCISFDEKNTKTWTLATEAALEMIGALNIARGNNLPLCLFVEAKKLSSTLMNKNISGVVV